MSDVIIRSVSTDTPAEALPVQGGDETVGNYDIAEPIAPVEPGEGAILQAMGIDDSVQNLPEADKANLSEVEGYVFNLLQGKGVTPTIPAISREIESLKYEMGLDPNAEPSAILDRIGGVLKSWKNLSFVRDPQEKKQLFFKLANAKSSKDMNRIVFETMEAKKVWQ